MKNPIDLSEGRLDLDDIEDFSFDIDHVMLGLECMPRFNGRSRNGTPISVFKHSVAVAKVSYSVALGNGLVPTDIRAATCLGLLHDAHEYVVGDITSPIKHLLDKPKYNAVVHAIDERMIAAALPRVSGSFANAIRSDAVRRIVKDADYAMLHAEAARLGFDTTYGYGPAPTMRLSMLAKQALDAVLSPQTYLLGVRVEDATCIRAVFKKVMEADSE